MAATIDDLGALNYRLATKAIGGDAKLGIIREGKRYTATVALAGRAGDGAARRAADRRRLAVRRPDRAQPVAGGRRGVVLSPATATGVIVSDVADGLERRRAPASSAATSSPRSTASRSTRRERLADAGGRAGARVEHDDQARRPDHPAAVPRIGAAMASLFEAAGLDKAAPRPLADRLRPERLDDVVGQDHLLGPDGALTPDAGDRLARLADLLGAARHRQDHRGAAARPRDRPPFRADLGGLLRRRRPEEGVRGRPRAGARRARARSSSSTRSTASTARSRTPSCRSWRTARSRWSAPPPRTRPSS